ncbi:flavodoxin domain-containing protein [Streptomyces sp. AN091965]|uniref:flavodoxin domain-containing protein n=1 Tax=Streptomyces sp. AN091965 TaxID=2927803 RepID=UPI001F60CB0C|nr:flavodoxin domain-containing protein [Streptomyces sp. AN091965]MCI3928852.1 flavodoxin domain-containing protein [Streptomyces sp. AN091965]
MAPVVLVAYGSTYGSTAELARTVGDTLRKAGLLVEVRSAGLVRDLTPYAAVVLGGALYAGRWQRDARRFARRHRAALARLPLWLFSSGPLDSSAAQRTLPPPPSVRRQAHRLGARGHITFGGRLDERADGWLAHRIVASGKGGDFRDFVAVSAWAEGVARELRTLTAPQA